MKKTVTVNIGGIVFHIDEDAFELLHKYLETIKAHFHTSEGKEEITSDIEARIAELFSEKLKNGKQVVSIEDVNEAIAIMGKPEEFGGDESNSSNASDKTKGENNQHSDGQYGYSYGYNYGGKRENYQYTGTYTKRRVYRNPDDKVLGGVCSGISSYLDIDPLWMRLIFAVMFFGFGSGLLIYIILWIIIPEAKTTAEKLEMRGEKVNVENIEKNIKEEMDNLKNKFEDFKKEAKDMGSKDRRDRARGVVGNIAHGFISGILVLINVFIKFFGVIFVVIGIAVFIVLIRILLGGIGWYPMGHPHLAMLFFDSRTQVLWSSIGISLLVGIPLLMLMYKGFRLIFNIKTRNRPLNIIAASVWLVGVVICSIIFFNKLDNYNEKSTTRIDANITQPAGDILYVDVDRNEQDEWSDNTHFQFGDIGTFSDDNGLINFHNVDLKIQKSNDDNFHLTKVQSARGRTYKEAETFAHGINSEVKQKDSLLIIPNYYSLDEKTKFKFQHLNFILKVPVGKSVYLAQRTKYILDDIDNLNDTEDRHMVNHKWVMTDRGLKCVDCKGL